MKIILETIDLVSPGIILGMLILIIIMMIGYLAGEVGQIVDKENNLCRYIGNKIIECKQ